MPTTGIIVLVCTWRDRIDVVWYSEGEARRNPWTVRRPCVLFSLPEKIRGVFSRRHDETNKPATLYGTEVRDHGNVVDRKLFAFNLLLLVIQLRSTIPPQRRKGLAASRKGQGGRGWVSSRGVYQGSTQKCCNFPQEDFARLRRPKTGQVGAPLTWTVSFASFAILALSGSDFFMMREMFAIGRKRSCSLNSSVSPIASSAMFSIFRASTSSFAADPRGFKLLVTGPTLRERQSPHLQGNAGAVR